MGGKGSGTPKAFLLKLDGTQVDENGAISKSTFFDFLDLDLGNYDHLNKTMTPEQALKFRNHIVRMKYGTSAAIPMLCGGPKCPVKQCPCHAEENWPLTEQCVIESRLIQVWTKSYIEDLQVDPDSITHMILVNRLVELDVSDYRANIGLSGGVDEEAWTLLKTTVTDNENFQQETVDVHPLMEIKEKNHRDRLKTLEALAATPKERYRKAAALKRKDDQDASTFFADLRNTLNKTQDAQSALNISDIKKQAEELAEDGIEDADWVATDD